MKVYLVINFGVSDCDEYCSYSAYKEEKDAAKAFNELMEQHKKENEDAGYDEENYDPAASGEFYYESWKEGEYSTDHDVIKMEALELR